MINKIPLLINDKIPSEPIGSVSPKINPQDRSTIIDREAGKTLNFLCPAQSYPSPLFR